MPKMGTKLRLNGGVWSVITRLFTDDTVLLTESEGDLHRVVNEFFSVCKRRKLKVFDRREEEVSLYGKVARSSELQDNVGK